MRKFLDIDRTKPRFRPERYELINNDFIKEINTKIPKTKGMSVKDLSSIVKGFNDYIRTYVCENREGVELPQGIGYLFLGVCKNSANTIDMPASTKYKQQISFKNWNSDGRLGKIFYSNSSVKYKILDNNLWIFKPAREFKKDSSKAFSENWKLFIEIDPKIKLSAYLRDFSYQRKVDKLIQEYAEAYNEFNI
jgi:hypothetical protein